MNCLPALVAAAFPLFTAAALPVLGSAALPVACQASTWFEALQREDGSWPADPSLAHPGAIGTVIPGRGADSLAITAAMTLAMLADGNTPSRGSHQGRVLRASEHLNVTLEQAPAGDVLPPGGALALYALAECAYADPEQVIRRSALVSTLDRALASVLGEPKEPLEEPALEDLGWLGLAAAVRLADGDGRMEEPFAACVRRLQSRSDESPTAAVFSLVLQLRDAQSRGLEDLSPFQVAFTEAARRLADSPSQDPALQTLLAASAYRIGGDTWKSHSRRALKPLTRRCAMTVLPRENGPSQSSTPIAFWPWSGDPRGTLWDTAWNVQSLTVYYRYSRLALTR